MEIRPVRSIRVIYSVSSIENFFNRREIKKKNVCCDIQMTMNTLQSIEYVHNVLLVNVAVHHLFSISDVLCFNKHFVCILTKTMCNIRKRAI